MERREQPGEPAQLEQLHRQQHGVGEEQDALGGEHQRGQAPTGADADGHGGKAAKAAHGLRDVAHPAFVTGEGEPLGQADGEGGAERPGERDGSERGLGDRGAVAPVEQHRQVAAMADD